MIPHNSRAKDVEIILDQLNILYEKEKTFDNLKYKNKLRFDYYLPKYNLCIEFNGAQHYEYIEHFHKDEDEFNEQKLKDYIKSEYCRAHDIHLIELPCSLTCEEIRAELVRFINEHGDKEYDLLPRINEFLDLNETQDVYINLLYEEYKLMLEDLNLDVLCNYKLFKDYVINYWDLKYNKLIKKDMKYVECWINQSSNINTDLANENNEYKTFIDTIQYTTLMNLDFIPNSVIHALYLDMNNKSLDDRLVISSVELISKLKPYMKKLGYIQSREKARRPKSCIKNINIIDNIVNYPNYEKVMSKNVPSQCWIKKVEVD